MSMPAERRDVDRPRGTGEAPSSVAETGVAPELPCRAADADEPMGGDPPCWAHLFEDDLTDQDR